MPAPTLCSHCHTALPATAGPEAASVGAASAALLSGFVAGLEGSRLRRYADEAGLDGGGGRRQLESRVLPRLRGEVQGWLAALADAPRQELQARCRAAGLEGEGSAGELALRLVVPQLQQVGGDGGRCMLAWRGWGGWWHVAVAAHVWAWALCGVLLELRSRRCSVQRFGLI